MFPLAEREDYITRLAFFRFLTRDLAVQNFYDFVKATILGGLLVLVPLAVLGVIVVKAVEVVHGVIEPLLAVLPVQSVGGVSLAFCAAAFVLLALCFLAGLIAETAITRRLVESIEALILSRIPGYSLMKAVGENIVGIEGKESLPTVLVSLNSVSSQLGFLMDQLPDGRQVVFVPEVPNALSGTLHLLPADRVEAISIPLSAALESLSRLGVGLNQKWPATTPSAQERDA